jgi:uncharacterized membrane-anchored protein YitT (DUF2179 family)
MEIKRHKVTEYFYIAVGSFITAVGVAVFANPAKIASGGVSGVATILYHSFGWDPGLMIMVQSVPLFLVGMKIFGAQYGLKSLIGTLLLSAFTSGICLMIGYDGILSYDHPMSVLLSALFGGVIMGTGIGLVMKSGSNTGGTDIIAQILARYTKLTLGTSLFLVDAVIIVASAFTFGIESALYAIITVYITGVVIDKVVLSMGTRYAKTVYIISDQREQISQAILEELGHGGTLLHATGMYTGNDRTVIMTVVPNQKISRLTNIVHEIDDKAFMIVQEAYQVLGEGFTPIAKAALASQSDVTQMSRQRPDNQEHRSPDVPR